MPVDVGDPSCMAEIVAVISGCERAEVKVLEVAAVAARFIKMLTAFQGYLYPLLGDYMALGNNDDCEESWAS